MKFVFLFLLGISLFCFSVPHKAFAMPCETYESNCDGEDDVDNGDNEPERPSDPDGPDYPGDDSDI